MPPAPTTTTGPNTSSFTTPAISSKPPRTISETNTPSMRARILKHLCDRRFEFFSRAQPHLNATDFGLVRNVGGDNLYDQRTLQRIENRAVDTRDDDILRNWNACCGQNFLRLGFRQTSLLDCVRKIVGFSSSVFRLQRMR